MTDDLFITEAYKNIQIGGVTRECTIVNHYLVLDEEVEFELNELIGALVDPDYYVLTDASQVEVLKKYGVITHPGNTRMCSSLTLGPNVSDFLDKIRALQGDMISSSKGNAS